MKNIKFLVFVLLSCFMTCKTSFVAAAPKKAPAAKANTKTLTPSTTTTTNTTTTTTLATTKTQNPTTPPNPNKKNKPTPTTPTMVQTLVNNYCRKSIAHLADNHPQLFKNDFTYFYDTIPYDGHIKDDPKFYKAIAWCLRNCITNQFFASTDTKNIIATFENDTNIYVLQFRVIADATEREQPKPIYTYKIPNNTKPICVIAITFLLNTVDDIKINEIENDGTQDRLIDTLYPCTYGIPNHYQHLIESLTNHGADKDAQRITLLEKIYNNIPVEFHVSSEKFYQTVLFWILTFFRDSFSKIEQCTAKGRIDIKISSNKNNAIIEYKLNKTKNEAFNQIVDRNYASYFNGDNKPIVLIGININTKKTPGSVIVETVSSLHKPVSVSPIKASKVTKKLDLD